MNCRLSGLVFCSNCHAVPILHIIFGVAGYKGFLVGALASGSVQTCFSFVVYYFFPSFVQFAIRHMSGFFSELPLRTLFMVLCVWGSWSVVPRMFWGFVFPGCFIWPENFIYLFCLFIHRLTTDLEEGYVGGSFRMAQSPAGPLWAVCNLGLLPTMGGLFLLHADGSALSWCPSVGSFFRCLQAAGLVEADYSLCSFRIGTATKAALWGLGEDVFKPIGSWKHYRCRLYICLHLL